MSLPTIIGMSPASERRVMAQFAIGRQQAQSRAGGRRAVADAEEARGDREAYERATAGSPAPKPRAQRPAKRQPPAQAPVATPLVRAAAARHGVNLATVAGTGKGGRITTADVAAAAHVTRDEQTAYPAHWRR